MSSNPISEELPKRYPQDEFEYPRLRIEAHPTIQSYLASRSDEELAALIFNQIYQRNIFGSYRGLSGEHAAAILAEAGRRADGKSAAASDVLAERARQIAVEGWTPEHDDSHDHGEMARAAMAYAYGATEYRGLGGGLRKPGSLPTGFVWRIWPWAQEWWKPSDDRRNLVKAGALILAEIERLDRFAGRAAHEVALSRAEGQEPVAYLHKPTGEVFSAAEFRPLLSGWQRKFADTHAPEEIEEDFAPLYLALKEVK
ncbi:Phage protein [Devosia sp. DBB001]|nr:Phage protein [Devosia sp. DBB001]